KEDAKIAADLAQCAVEVITDAEAIGRFESISQAQMFDMEYWPLERAKLGSATEKPLAGEIAVITGGGGTIGRATAKTFAAAGAEGALLDCDERAPADAAKAIGAAGPAGEGGGGRIGRATAKTFAAAGAEVALLDCDERAAADAAKAIGAAALAVKCDVTDGACVRDAFARVVAAFGGVDIVVSNAGAAWQG